MARHFSGGIFRKTAMAMGAAGSAFAAKALLPSLITKLANLALARVPGYPGHVERAEIHWLSGRITLMHLAVDQETDNHREPLLEIDHFTVIANWRHLFKGIVSAEVYIDRPRAVLDLQTFQKSKTVPEHNGGSLKKEPWQDKVRRLIPFQVNLTIRQGEFHVRHLPGQNGTDVAIRDFDLAADNLTNNTALSPDLLAHVLGRARIMSQGQVMVQWDGYPLAVKPTFNVDMKVQDVDLRELGHLLERYTGVEIRHGQFGLVSEIAAYKGQVNGYVKPIIDHLDIESREEEGFKGRMKAAPLEAIVKLLQSRTEERIATRVDFEGAIDHPEADVPRAVGLMLKNAFVRALDPDYERRIHAQKPGEAAIEAQIQYKKESVTRLGRLWEIIKQAAKDWAADEAPRMSAALSYYTVFSMAPLLLLVIAIVGFVYGREAAQGQIVAQLTGLIGPRSAAAIEGMIRGAGQPMRGTIATIVGIITLLVGATGVLAELKQTLNKIWRTNEPDGFKEIVRRNAKFLGIILAIGFLLIVSLVISAVLSWIGSRMGGVVTIPTQVYHAINFLVTFGVITGLFAILYKFLPNTWVPWRDVWTGSAVTALLFTIGKLLLGLYLGKSIVSTYGAAASVLLILLWIYYSGAIFYFGAEFTHVYSTSYGSRRELR